MTGNEVRRRFELVSGELVTISQFMITSLLAASASSMSTNMNKGINSLRCASVAIFMNAWMPLGSFYFALRQFGLSAFMTDLLDEYYPYLCSCQRDVEEF